MKMGIASLTCRCPKITHFLPVKKGNPQRISPGILCIFIPVLPPWFLFHFSLAGLFKLTICPQQPTWLFDLKVKVAQLCLTLCDPKDYTPWNSPGQNTGVGCHAHLQGIFPTQGSNLRLVCLLIGRYGNTGEGSHSLLQGLFPTQGLNPGLPHCRWILYQLTHKGSPTFWFTSLIILFFHTLQSISHLTVALG